MDTGDTQFQIIDSALNSEFLTASDVSAFQMLKGKEDFGTHTGLLTHCDEVVGLADLYIRENEADVLILNMEVKASARGSKFGAVILKSLFDHVVELTNQLSLKKGFILVDGFTDDGKKHILPELCRLSERYDDVEFYKIPGA